MRLSRLAYRESDKGDCVRTDMLQEFIVWAESKTIEAAAKEMHISQSTLSKHLIALETELGISLINRHDKGRLTPAGVRFYNGIVDVVERLNKTVEESRQIAEKTDYEIIVWDPYVFSGAMRELERIMHAFSKECSVPFHFTLRNEAYKTPSESLAEGLVDVAIGYHPFGAEGEAPQGSIEFDLMEEPLVLWCKKGHPLARKEQLLPEDLKGVPIMCSMELAHPLAPAIRRCVRKGGSSRGSIASTPRRKRRFSSMRRRNASMSSRRNCAMTSASVCAMTWCCAISTTRRLLFVVAWRFATLRPTRRSPSSARSLPTMRTAKDPLRAPALGFGE